MRADHRLCVARVARSVIRVVSHPCSLDPPRRLQAPPPLFQAVVSETSDPLITRKHYKMAFASVGCYVETSGYVGAVDLEATC